MTPCIDFTPLISKSERVMKYKSPKRRYSGMKKLATEWQDLSKQYLLNHCRLSDVYSVKINLDNISSDNMDAYFADFYSVLNSTAILSFDSWLHCHLSLQNAIRHGYQEFEATEDEE